MKKKPFHDKIFVHTKSTDPNGRTAGIRDGVISILVGVTEKAINTAELTDLKPKKNRCS